MPETERLLLQAGRRLRAATPSSSRRRSRDLALWHLLRNLELPSLDAAVEHMTAAADLGREDSATLADLGAIYYLRAAAAGDPHDLEEGLRLVDRALEIDPRQVEALFNRALLVEALVLPTAARDAWREYLSRESPSSPWRHEALAHLARLSEPTMAERWQRALREPGVSSGPPRGDSLRRLAQSFPENTREWIETELLPGWAESWQQGMGETAKARLRTAWLAAKALAERSGDPFLPDLVANVGRIVTDGNEERVRRLARSLLAYREGRTAFAEGRPAAAWECFRSAESVLEPGPTSLHSLLRYHQAACVFGMGRYPEAARQLSDLKEADSARHWSGLKGREETFLGLIRNLQGAPEDGRDEFHLALTHLTDPAYLSDAALAHDELGESYDMLGDRELAWPQFYEALRSNLERGSPYRTVQIYNSLADFTLRLGDVALSYRYQNAAVDASRQLNNPGFAADVLLWRALLQVRLGRPLAARRDLARAAAQGMRIVDRARSDRFRADFEFINGTISFEQDPRSAIRLLTAAIRYYKTLGHWPSLLLAYEALAQAHRAAADPVAEKEDLIKSLALYERVGRDTQDDSMRSALAGVIENAFDHMAEFLVTREKNPGQAVQFLERAKILNWPIPHPLSMQHETPVEPSELRRLLQPRTALVEYAVLSDRLLTRVETSSSETFYEQRASPEQVDRLVGGFLDRDWNSADWRRASDELYRLLVQPWFAESQFDTLVLVPDKSLYRLSFAALWSAERQRLLVEDAALVVSPSATLFALASERDRALSDRSAGGEILVLTASSPGDEGDLLLPRLDRARAEGAHIRALFPRSTVLLSGSEAVPSAFFRHAHQARWIHFAGHSVASPNRPLESILIFASPGRGQRSTVSGAEIQSLAFPATRLVALSACSTAAAPRAAWPGALSLARPFLTAGVPTVLGSLWEVDDAEAELLFRGFYEALRSGVNPAEALRRAQLHLLLTEGRDHLSKPGWPAFEVLGGPVLDRQEAVQ